MEMKTQRLFSAVSSGGSSQLMTARFAPSMSGGLVIDEDGALCGLVCASLNTLDPNELPLSYAATLWPMLTTMITVDRGDKYARGVAYPMIDLVRDKMIHAVGLEELDPGLFPGRALPRKIAR